MAALVVLGARLTRAGGRLRFLSVVVGCALAVALLTLAWELPEAMFPAGPDPLMVDPLRGPVATTLAVIAAPVVALILAVGRLSSEVRDRRLGALVLLGLGRRGVLLVAAVEILIPALLGSALGVGVFLLLRLVLTAVAAPVLAQPIAVGGSLAVVAAAVVALAAVLALAPVRRLRGLGAGVFEAVVLRPSLWRLTPLPIALGLLLAVYVTPPDHVSVRTAYALFGAAVAAAATVVLSVPLLTSQVARMLARGHATWVMLAGRSMETHGVAISRRVTALGVTTFIAFVAIGYLGLYESSGVRASYVHQVEEGPQEIWVSSPGEQPVPADLSERLAALPAVEGVIPRPTVSPASCAAGGGVCPRVFVGTCSQLALVAAVAGCADGRAAWITHADAPGDLFAHLWEVDAAHAPTRVGLSIGDTGESFSARVGSVLTQDVRATMDRWWHPERIDLFVPSSIARENGAPEPPSVNVIASAGGEVRGDVERLAEEYGMQVFAPAMPDYEQVVTMRVTVWTVVGASIAVALLVFVVASIDRARARRRGRARLVAVGIPARILRGSQALATAVPLATAIAMALGLGWAALTALLRLDTSQRAGLPVDGSALITVCVVITIGALTASLATLPLTRSRIRPEDLRHE
ncbi:hypothetical protein [Pseudactinotalea sp. HY158]|uniref:hypothetical protein n=1 Tax=Pseudactinotalea sp. HY158 TaxID=2654547 RepID=UPI00129C47B2|nr:hypothetical protein [Pseudactinotalea sp. HY158]QGH69963.1 hypothetical protein GCE65_10940 [Pseudactinotalea sp. HY158]